MVTAAAFKVPHTKRVHELKIPFVGCEHENAVIKVLHTVVHQRSQHAGIEILIKFYALFDSALN